MKKSHFVLWRCQKKCHWAILSKMGQNSTLAKNDMFFIKWPEKRKRYFCKNNYFWFSCWSERIAFSAEIEFLFHFGNMAQWHYFDSARKQKVIFSTKNHFLFTVLPLLVAGKISCSITQKLFWQILLLRPKVEDFEPLGVPFNPATILSIIDHLPTRVDKLLTLIVDKNWKIWDYLLTHSCLFSYWMTLRHMWYNRS